MQFIERTDDEIQAIQDWIDLHHTAGSHYRGMSYEDGLQAMLDWLTDKDADDPRG